jgi:hypothetical protein
VPWEVGESGGRREKKKAGHRRHSTGTLYLGHLTLGRTEAKVKKKNRVQLKRMNEFLSCSTGALKSLHCFLLLSSIFLEAFQALCPDFD